MKAYFQLSRKSAKKRRGSITIFKLIFVVLFLTALVFCIKHFDVSSLIHGSKLSKSVKMAPEITACLVEVRGDNGSGTGFFAELKGKSFIVTNVHVLSGNKKIEFYSSNGETIPIGNIFAAEDYDIAIIQVDSSPATLSVKKEIDKQI